MNKLQITNSLGYSGTVVIKYRNKSGHESVVSTHNESLPPLSELFARCVTGYDTSSYVPVGLDVCQDGSSILVSYPPLTGNRIELDSTDDRYVAVFEIVLRKANIGVFDTTKEITLHLINANGQKLNSIPFVDASGELITDISEYVNDGTNLVIKWKMKLIDNTSSGGINKNDIIIE